MDYKKQMIQHRCPKIRLFPSEDDLSQLSLLHDKLKLNAYNTKEIETLPDTPTCVRVVTITKIMYQNYMLELVIVIPIN